MIKVSTKDGTRTGQITSPGPDRGTYWVRTCDDQPAIWLLVREWRDDTDPNSRIGYQEVVR